MAECFTDDNSYELLQVCIMYSTSQMFHSCIKLFTEVFKLDILKINSIRKGNTLLNGAVRWGNYEAAEYFVACKATLQNRNLLENCVEPIYYRDDILKRENILHLLLNEEKNLIHETPNILLTCNEEVRLFKILVNSGANLNAVNIHNWNSVMNCAGNLSPSDFHELVQFLLFDHKAEYLFVDNEKWKDPMPHIIWWAVLLPKTLELMLTISGIEVHMKDRNGENLLFSAAAGNKVENFQQLVHRGLDYNEKGRRNRSLLHAGSEFGGVEMVRYLLSRKLDPNCRDDDQLTPLHCAARANALDIMEILEENGANVQVKNSKGQTALHLSAANYNSSIQIIEYLIGKGVGVNDRDNDGNTPLNLCEREETRNCLIKMGADIQTQNNEGQTPAQINTKL